MSGYGLNSARRTSASNPSKFARGVTRVLTGPTSKFNLWMAMAGLISIVIGIFVNLIGYDTASPDGQKTRSIVFTFFYTFGAGLIFLSIFLAMGFGCK